MNHLTSYKPTVLNFSNQTQAVGKIIKLAESFRDKAGSLGVGRTQDELFANEKFQDLIKSTTYYQMDDYIHSDPDNPNLLRNVIDRKLFDKIGYPQHLKHTFDSTVSPEFAVQKMIKELEKIGNLNFIITSAGEKDNHVAFIPEGTDFNIATLHCDVPEDARWQNRGLWDGINNVPYKAFTLGPKTFIEAGALIIMLFGENKRQTYQTLVHDKGNYYSKLIRQNRNTLIISDQAALRH